jgi:hypothetical protein
MSLHFICVYLFSNIVRKVYEDSLYVIYEANPLMMADPSGRAVCGLRLRLLACWNYGFEFRRGRG